jgi:hypothetical protein
MQATGVTVTKYVKYRRKRTFGFHKMRGIYLLAEKRLVSQEGVCSLEFISKEENKTEVWREKWMRKRDAVIFLDI